MLGDGARARKAYLLKKKKFLNVRTCLACLLRLRKFCWQGHWLFPGACSGD